MKKSHPHNLISLMNNRLQRKYKTILSFYEAKSINQILSMNPHCTTYMGFCDLRLLSEEIQYLKRVYYHRTLTGKPEIQQRMKIICKHYATNPALSTFTYQYPMMILTNTKSLFIRRKRRLRKIQAGQGSSDFTEQRDQQFLQFEPKSQNFLDDLQNSAISEQEDQQQDSVSFESAPYYVFQEILFQGPKEVENIKININQDDVKHLIEDYTNFSQGDRGNTNSEAGSIRSSVNKFAFASIENQHKTQKESTIQIFPIQQRPRQEKKEKKSSLLGDLITQILQRPISFQNLGLNNNNKQTNQFRTIGFQSEQQSLEKQKQQRASRRHKIREKAEELLRKVRNATQKYQ